MAAGRRNLRVDEAGSAWRVSKAVPVTGLLVAVALTVAAALLVPSVESGRSAQFYLPESDPYVQAESEALRHFHGASYLLVVVEASDPFAADAMGRVGRVVNGLQEIEGVLSVHALPTVQDVRNNEGVIERVPLVDPDNYSAERLRRTLSRQPLYERLFISAEARGQFVYVLPETNAAARAVASAVLDHPTVAEDPAVFAYGDSVVDVLVARQVVGEFSLLASLAVTLIFGLNLFFFGAFSWGLSASAAGVLPAFWLLGAFPVFGISLSPTTSLAPIMVLILATTYVFHVLRVFCVRRASHGELLRQIGPVVFGASGTTVLGMASLFISPEPQLHTLAGLVILGVLAAAASSLVVLPWVAARLPTPESRPWERLLGRVAAGRKASRKAVGAAMWAIVGGTLIMGLGAVGIGVDYRAAAGVTSGSELHARMQRYTAHSGGVEQLQLVIDSGGVYGFVDPARFAGAERVARRLQRSPEIAEVVSIVPFVKHTHATLVGAADSVPPNSPMPESERQLAEALETLEQGEQTLRIGSLIDPEWRRLRYFLWFSDPDMALSEAGEELARLRANVEAIVGSELPEAQASLLGPSLYRIRAKERSLRSLFGSIGLFLAAAALALAVVLRSRRSVAGILLPPLLALVAYFGLAGWLGAHLTLTMLFGAVLLLGVGNDDALYFTLSYRRFAERREGGAGTDAGTGEQTDKRSGKRSGLSETYRYSGVPIVQTTLLIIVGCGPLLISSYSGLRMMAALIPGGMLVSTLATLLVTPSVLGAVRGRIPHEPAPPEPASHGRASHERAGPDEL